MVWQNDNGLDIKRVLLFDRVEGLPEKLHGFGMVEKD